MTLSEKINIFLKSAFTGKELNNILLEINSEKLNNKNKILSEIAKNINYSNKQSWDELLEISDLNPYILDNIGLKFSQFNEKQKINYLKKLVLLNKQPALFSSIENVLSNKNLSIENENNCFILLEKHYHQQLDTNSQLFIKRNFKNPHNIKRISPYLTNIYIIKNLAIHPQIDIEGKQLLIEKLRWMIANKNLSNIEKDRIFRIIKTIHNTLGNSPAEVLTKLLS